MPHPAKPSIEGTASTLLCLAASVVQERDGNAALEALLCEQLDQIIAIAAVERLTRVAAKLKTCGHNGEIL